MIWKSEILQYICTDKICHMNLDTPFDINIEPLRQDNRCGSLDAICFWGYQPACSAGQIFYAFQLRQDNYCGKVDANALFGTNGFHPINSI